MTERKDNKAKEDRVKGRVSVREGGGKHGGERGRVRETKGDNAWRLTHGDEDGDEKPWRE